MVGGKIEVKVSPSFDAKAVKVLYDDAVVAWEKEVIGQPSMAQRQEPEMGPDAGWLYLQPGSPALPQRRQ